MKLGKWVLGIAALTLLLGGMTYAQTLPNSKLCLHNGSEYYVTGGFHCFPNHVATKYHPSYAHMAGLRNDNFPGGYGVDYPWKIAGWAWGGMQGFNNYGPTWYWETCLQFSRDNPRHVKTSAETFDMTWEYPVLVATGQIPHSGAPYPIYGAAVPVGICGPMGGNDWQCPSTCGGWNAYMNIFACGWASWNISGTLPGYGWTFAFTLPCDYPVCVPSVAGTAPCTCTSIWQSSYMCKGTHDQYVLLSGNEGDCNVADRSDDGNKTRNYSIIGDCDGGWLWYWNNTCDGRGEEWGMCLMVCDTVTIPVNTPGTGGPFAGFDVGPATLMPYSSEGCVVIDFMTDASTPYGQCGAPHFILAGFGGACAPGNVPYKGGLYKLHHGWDLLTNVFLGVVGLYVHIPLPGYPACCFGTACGANTAIGALWPSPSPLPVGTEITYESLALSPGFPPSAGYMVTLF
jgi:hypothetical protein